MRSDGAQTWVYCERSRKQNSTIAYAKLLSLVLLFTLPAAVQAQFKFMTNNGTITITQYTGSGGEVTIPATTNGLPVTGIGGWAFQINGASVTRVTIPNSATNFGPGAFAYCSSLSSVVIPDGTITLDRTFEYCSGLTNVTIPNSVTSIGLWAFEYCTSLTSVTIPDSVVSIGSVAFGSCSSLTSVTIPTNVTSIGNYVFQYCTSLTNVTIPASVTSIPLSAFFSCTSLTSITLPATITSIGSVAFASCTSLTRVYCKGDAPSLGSYVFQYNTNATVYYLPGKVGWGITFGTNPARPTALWKPKALTDGASFGVRTNQFGFTISWASGMDVAVDACTNLASPVWTPLQTNTLTADAALYRPAMN